MRELGKADMGDVWTSPWARATLVSNFYSLVLDNLTDARFSVSESEQSWGPADQKEPFRTPRPGFFAENSTVKNAAARARMNPCELTKPKWSVCLDQIGHELPEALGL